VHRSTGTVSVIDPRRREVIGAPIDVGTQPVAIETGLGGVWVTNYADDTVSLIDPVTRQVSGAPIPVGDGPLSIAAGAGAVWVANTDGTVSRLEP
jgi:YVTN family beta-propeller protein